MARARYISSSVEEQVSPEIHINVSQIPSFRREELARGALALVEQVFAMPGAEERYQEWLKEYRARKSKANSPSALRLDSD